MTLSNRLSRLLPTQRNRSDAAEADPVVAALSAAHGDRAPDVFDALEASLRANRLSGRTSNWLARTRQMLRRPRITQRPPTLPQLPEGMAFRAALPAPARAARAQVAQLAHMLYGDDAFHRNVLVYKVITGVTIGEGDDRALSEQDFGSIKRVLNRVWDKNCTHDLQRAFITVAYDRDTAAGILENPALTAALSKLARLHTAAANRWSERFLRVMLGPRVARNPMSPQPPLPENLVRAMGIAFDCKPEHQAALQALIAQEMSTADMAALQALGDTDLGRGFLQGARRAISHIAQHPQLFDRLLKNTQKVTTAVISDYALNVAMDARAVVLYMRHRVQQAQNHGMAVCSEQGHAKSIAAFADALKNAHAQKLLDPHDIETMSAETFMALPGWVVLAAVQKQLGASKAQLSFGAIAEEVFHREATKPSVESLLACLNAMESLEARSAAVAEASRLLTAMDAQDATPAAAAVLAATKRVGSEMLSGDRQLFAELCAKAYEVFGASL